MTLACHIRGLQSTSLSVALPIVVSEVYNASPDCCLPANDIQLLKRGQCSDFPSRFVSKAASRDESLLCNASSAHTLSLTQLLEAFINF